MTLGVNECVNVCVHRFITIDWRLNCGVLLASAVFSVPGKGSASTDKE